MFHSIPLFLSYPGYSYGVIYNRSSILDSFAIYRGGMLTRLAVMFVKVMPHETRRLSGRINFLF